MLDSKNFEKEILNTEHVSVRCRSRFGCYCNWLLMSWRANNTGGDRLSSKAPVNPACSWFPLFFDVF